MALIMRAGADAGTLTMAVLIEAISVIIRADAIENKLHGGWRGLAALLSNATLCSDGELARIGFLSPPDTSEFVQELEAAGLVYLYGTEAVDLVVADQRQGLLAHCDWAEFGQIAWHGHRDKPVSAAWLNGSSCPYLVTPMGWTFAGSLSEHHLFVETGRLSEFFDYVRTENDMKVYRDLRTGQEICLPHYVR